jgi:dihydrofolate reductase
LRKLFGRLTYQGMAHYWPSATGEVAEIMNNITKVVFSRTLEKADWGNTTLIRSQADSAVEEMKLKQGKDMLIFGSANLSSTLMQSGLIDEYRLGIVPVVLGGGNPLFKPGAGRKRMRLIEATPLRSGCVILRYGAVPT